MHGVCIDLCVDCVRVPAHALCVCVCVCVYERARVCVRVCLCVSAHTFPRKPVNRPCVGTGGSCKALQATAYAIAEAV